MHGHGDGKKHDRDRQAGEGNFRLHGLVLFRPVGLSANLSLGRDEEAFGSKPETGQHQFSAARVRDGPEKPSQFQSEN
jgi:hypothetical protein